MTDLGWADACPGPDPAWGEIFCLVFVRGLPSAEGLRLVGGLPDTLAVRTAAEMTALHTFDDGYPLLAGVLELGEWTVICQPNSFECDHLVDRLSRGTEAVSVLRHDYASHRFTYAVDGVSPASFDPTFPAWQHGPDHGFLLPRLKDCGFDLAGNRADAPIAAALRLAETFTGVLPTFGQLIQPLPSTEIELWFSEGRRDYDGPADAVAETRRLAEALGLAHIPELAEALAAAERGSPAPVTPTSSLGRQVRGWLTECRRSTWSFSADVGNRGRMTEEQHHRASDLGWLCQALGAALS